MIHGHKATSFVVLMTMLTTLVAGPATDASAGAPTEDLKQIEYKYYFRGKYQEAIKALQNFLARSDVGAADAVRAREFLAASHVLGGQPAMGKAVFLQLISRHPTYRGPDPAVFKPDVISAYAGARSEYASIQLKTAPEPGPGKPAAPAVSVDQGGKPIFKQWWMYAGVVGVVAIAALLAGGDETSPPATPPGTVTVGVRVQ